MSDTETLFALIIVGIIILAILLIPYWIAKSRNHSYQSIILVLCLIPTGFTWFIGLVWALWPQEKSLIDPIAGNVTGTGTRNVGHTASDVIHGSQDKLDRLQRMNDLRQSGALTDDEFSEMKASLLGT